MDAEELRGPPGAFDDAFASLQRRDDMGPLGLLEGGGQPGGWRGLSFRGSVLEVTSGRDGDGRRFLSSSSAGPRESTTARSITFCSSRMFPGHG